MRKIALSVSFFFITPITIFTSIIFLLFLSQDQKFNTKQYGQGPNKVAFAALPPSESMLESNVISQDMRVDVLKQFFSQYKSPLEPFASNIVSEADKYDLDYRLLPSIAMQESNLCKKIITDSYNCWGFGIYGKKVTRFESYPEAIATVSKTLAKNYIAGGLDTPEEIMKKYTPSNNGVWADNVNYYMDKLQF